MQSNFELMNVTFQNSFASSVLSGFTGYSATGLSVTFNLTTDTYFVAVVNGLQWFVPAGDSRLTNTVSASKDTYVDVTDVSGVLTFTLNAVANNATPPTLAAGALRIAVIVSGTSAVSSVAFFSVPTTLAFALGGGGNCNNPPTSGTLTGEYWQAGNYSTTGTITANQVRLHVVGDILINNAITVSTEMPGGISLQLFGSSFSLLGSNGAGNSPGITGGGAAAGSGGGNGGAGGRGGSTVASFFVQGGPAIPFLELTGSGGGAGGGGASTLGTGGAGGNGGGGIYIEASGNIIINANIAANGTAGSSTSTASNGGGGGGSGGCIELRAGGQIFIASGVTLSAQGGAGGNSTNATKGGGGGGGGGGFIRLKGNRINNQGTLAVNGGSAGTGSATEAGTAGSTGVTDTTAVIWGPRSAN
jgi:hypothetical protein